MPCNFVGPPDPNATQSTDPSSTDPNAAAAPNQSVDPNASGTPNQSTDPNACVQPPPAPVARGAQKDNSLGPPVHDTYPDLPETNCTLGLACTSFTLKSVGYALTMGGAINYVKGWIQFLISLGNTVPAETGGSGVANFGNNPGSFTGSDWRYAMQSTQSPSGYSYWNGTAWKYVPDTWSDPTNTLLMPTGTWVEGTTNKCGYGTWPSAIPAWGPTEEATASTTLPKWVNTIQTVWSNVFDIKRDQCPSTDPQCCRYHPVASVSFVLVTTKSGNTIVVAGNNARSVSDAWSMLDPRVNTCAHEFGHHLGNPDEYAGGGYVDPSVNTDGATAGIDPDSIMGQNMTVVKKRHFNTIIKQLKAMVDTAAAKTTTYTYQCVPGLSGTIGTPNASQSTQ